MSVTLHPLDEDNFEVIELLSISDEEWNHSQLGSMEDIREAWRRNVSTRTALAIFNTETIVGYADYAPTGEAGEYQILHFLIDENHRRRGYGEQALRSMIAELCQKPDCEKIIIAYMSFNDSGAIELYEKVGFIEQPADDEAGDRFGEIVCIK